MPSAVPVVDLRRRRRALRAVRVVGGMLLWAGLVAATWRGVEELAAAERAADGAGVVARLVDYLRAPDREIELDFAAPRRARIGDPIFVQSAARPFEQVGVITALRDADGPVTGGRGRRRVQATGGRAWLYPDAPALGADAHLAWYHSDRSLAWVWHTLLPPAKQRRVRELIDAAVQAHGEELATSLTPVVRASLRDALRAVERELPAILRAHRGRMQELGIEYEQEFVRAELLPLVESELFPLLERRARPLLTDIGRQIWARVSLWRVGSRYVWDRLPLTAGTSLEREWNRVLRQEALPVLQERSDELLALARDVVRDAARNPAVRAALRRGYGMAVEDPRVHALAWSVFRQAVVDNEALHEAVAARWRDEPARRALELLGERIDPTLRRIGDLVLGTRQHGITPEFAAVLRNRLLLKDRRWFVLHPGDPAAPPPAVLPVVPGAGSADPFVPAEGR